MIYLFRPAGSTSDLVLDHVEVGRIALYEIIIQSKRGAVDFDSAGPQQILGQSQECHRRGRIGERVLDETKPGRVILYNAFYSVNRSFADLPSSADSAVLSSCGDNLSNRLQTLVLAHDHAFSYYRHLCAQWPHFDKQPLSAECHEIGTNHLLEVARGRSVWAYSAAPGIPSTLGELFGIDAAKKSSAPP